MKPISPSVLAWARNYAKRSLEEAAAAICVREDDVAAWENGNASPTIKQLRKLATFYNLHLAILFRDTPPPPEDDEEWGDDDTSPPSREEFEDLKASLRRLRDLVLCLASRQEGYPIAGHSPAYNNELAAVLTDKDA